MVDHILRSLFIYLYLCALNVNLFNHFDIKAKQSKSNPFLHSDNSSKCNIHHHTTPHYNDDKARRVDLAHRHSTHRIDTCEFTYAISLYVLAGEWLFYLEIGCNQHNSNIDHRECYSYILCATYISRQRCSSGRSSAFLERNDAYFYLFLQL